MDTGSNSGQRYRSNTVSVTAGPKGAGAAMRRYTAEKPTSQTAGRYGHRWQLARFPLWLGYCGKGSHQQPEIEGGMKFVCCNMLYRTTYKYYKFSQMIIMIIPCIEIRDYR
ncbi:hypothetical protein AAEU76_001619 [Salmonella enterica subsp. enterica serovar Wedding]